MSKNRIWLISDTHFGHSNILKYEPVLRPFKTIQQHDEELIYRWNHVVKPDDTVWHLGDVAFGRENLEVLDRLNGRKNLVPGNHDAYGWELYLKRFNKVLPYAKLGGAFLSHVPIHECQFSRVVGNIHGHMHSKTVNDPRYVNVSVEQTDLAPILLEKVLAKFPKKL